MVSKEDMKMFISEAEDLIQQIEESILSLEDDFESKKPFQDLFFAFHTLKGLTGMVGLENVSKFCHQFESFIDTNKEKKEIKNKKDDFTNLLFESLDVLRTVINESKKGNVKDLDDQFLSEIIESFNGFTGIDESSLISLIDEREIKSLLKQKGNKYYKIYIRIQASCIFKKVRAFIIFRALNSVGHIIYSNPSPETLEKGDYESDFDLYYMSKKETLEINEILKEILEIESKVITEISSDEFQELIDAREFEELDENMAEPEISKEKMSELGKITGVKVDIEILEKLMNYFGEVIVIKNQINQILQEKKIWDVNRLFDNMDKLFLEIQEIIFELKLVRVGSTFRRYKRLVRDLSKELGKDIDLILEGMSVEIDRKILEEIGTPMLHLIRNAIYHGIETPEVRKSNNKDSTGHLKIKTTRQASSISIEVIDDGKGINYDSVRQKVVDQGLASLEEAEEFTEEMLNQYILMPGFTTLTNADMTSGRGMGLAIVTEKIKELGGQIRIESKKNVGTRFVLNVPFTRAILKAQIVEISGDLFAIPIENLKQIYFYDNKSIEYVKGKEFYRIESKLVPVMDLSKYFEIKKPSNEQEIKYNESKIALHCGDSDENSLILLVEGIQQQMEIVIKPFRSKYSNSKGISGVSITGDGSICLLLDIPEIMANVYSSLKELEISEVVQ
ncbi:MAG: chemotaxis protein CheA [Candidatus Lokiarchaeota archaeon]|nr:chemotaxis protein CheA [Candidatus Lokiarchaeota archaeon]